MWNVQFTGHCCARPVNFDADGAQMNADMGFVLRVLFGYHQDDCLGNFLWSPHRVWESTESFLLPDISLCALCTLWGILQDIAALVRLILTRMGRRWTRIWVLCYECCLVITRMIVWEIFFEVLTESGRAQRGQESSVWKQKGLKRWRDFYCSKFHWSLRRGKSKSLDKISWSSWNKISSPVGAGRI